MRIWDTITETGDAVSIGAGFLLVDKAKTPQERKEKFLAAMDKLQSKTESKFIRDMNAMTKRLAAKPGVLEAILDELLKK